MRASAVCLALLGLIATGASGQEWAGTMFRDTSHDFGTVARGAFVQHRFVFENRYNEDVHVKSVRSSCGCTAPTITKSLLKRYETSEIVATVDTRRFEGYKAATVTVLFDQPLSAEVQLHVNCFIRRDVVVEPGEVQFGTVVQGAGAARKLKVSYAGRPDWRLLDIRSVCPHLEAQLAETQRARANGTYEVAYDLTVRLKPSAPPGPLKELLFLVTDDASADTARVPVDVEGIVLPPLTVSPSPLLLGILQPRQSTSRNLIVRGDKPFRIVEAAVPDARFRIPLPADLNAVHVLPVEFTAGPETGKIAGKIRLKTDLPGNEVLEVGVDGQVVIAAAAKPDEPWPEDFDDPRR